MPEARAPRRDGIRSTRGHRLHIEKPRPPHSIDLKRDALHRHFWRRRGERDRLPINIGELAESLGVSYDTANAVVIAMRDEGRLRAVAWKKVRIRIYQVADPAQWTPGDRSTHALRASEPLWG